MRLYSIAVFCLIILTLFSCSESDDPGSDNSDPGLDVESIQIFPENHPINMDISSSPIDPNSEAILDNIGRTIGLHADFGSGLWEGAPIGIPFEVVDAEQPMVPINYRANDYDGNYGSESDPGPMPIPLDAAIEGNGQGDSHVIAVDAESGFLYELYNASRTNEGWGASSGAVFDFSKTEYRPLGFTSADAAGLPIFPLLVRYEEIEKGEIDHAIRFTLSNSKIYRGFVRPGNHHTPRGTADNLLPYGARLRLKTDVDIAGYSATNQIILEAMKKYGIILSDGGSSMFISGAPNENWDNDDLRNLRNMTVNDFEVVAMGQIYTTY